VCDGRRRRQGTVKAWLPKGFGFIVPDEHGPDVFCHINDLDDADALKVGQRVSYEPSQSKDGRPRAVKVRCVDNATPNAKPVTPDSVAYAEAE
jgi:CspA family cold shock protein